MAGPLAGDDPLAALSDGRCHGHGVRGKGGMVSGGYGWIRRCGHRRRSGRRRDARLPDRGAQERRRTWAGPMWRGFSAPLFMLSRWTTWGVMWTLLVVEGSDLDFFLLQKGPPLFLKLQRSTRRNLASSLLPSPERPAALLSLSPPRYNAPSEVSYVQRRNCCRPR